MTDLYGGVETGGTKIVCVLGTGPEQIVAESRFDTTSPAETIERIGEFFDAQAQAPAAVGVGAFGPIGVDPDAADWGVLGRTPKPGWPGAALGPGLRERLGVPIVLDSDVNAAALGEQRWGAGIGCDPLVYLTVGTGIGAGLIVAGRSHRGLTHPEAGHMRIPHDAGADPFPGACPYHLDCWEGLAAGSAMQARWGRPASELPAEHPGWELEAGYLAAGIANLILVLCPERFILGGGVFEHPGLLDTVRVRVAQVLAGYLSSDLLDDLDHYLVEPGLAGRAGSLGAIALAQQAPRPQR